MFMKFVESSLYSQEIILNKLFGWEAKDTCMVRKISLRRPDQAW